MGEQKRTLVLSVKGSIATTPAKRVRLGVTLTIEVGHRHVWEGERVKENAG